MKPTEEQYENALKSLNALTKKAMSMNSATLRRFLTDDIVGELSRLTDVVNEYEEEDWYKEYR